MKVCQEFVDLYHSLEALLLTQILINRSVILSTLVEDQGQESARLFALPITRDYCRLIFTRQNELTEKQSVEVKVIVRKGRGIVPLSLTLDTPLSLETETEKRDYLIKKLYAETALEAGFILEHFIHKIRQMSRDSHNLRHTPGRQVSEFGIAELAEKGGWLLYPLRGGSTCSLQWF